MSAQRPIKRPAPNLKDPSTPINAFTPQSQQSGGGGGVIDTPTPISHDRSESPERANKRARFENSSTSGQHGANSDVKPTLQMRNGLGQVGRSVSQGRGGAAWVHDRFAELEGLYKECILAATLLLQYRSYSRTLGLSTKYTPVHLSQRLERAWTQYESLRSHIEAYLLTCAQSANTSPPNSLPTPSSLVPGYPPLPATPSIPVTASTLLSLTPHPGRMGRVSLDKLLAADPGKGLIGYEKGQVVFPGVPTDVAMPVEPQDDLGAGEISTETVMPISLPGVDYGAGIKQQNGPNESGENGLDLDSLGIAELSALINGDGDGVLGGAVDVGGGLAAGSVFTPETTAMLENINQYNQQSRPIDSSGPPTSVVHSTGQQVAQEMLASLATGTQNQNTQNQFNTQIDQSEQILTGLTTTLPTQSQPSQAIQQPFSLPNTSSVTNQPSQSQQQPSQTQQQTTNPPPIQNFDFDFSTLEGVDSMDNLDSLADIDFNELAGMLGTSGRTTRQATPTATTTASVGLGMGNLYPDISNTGQTAAEFDGSLGGINLDDFDFGGRDGEGSMPGVDGDEFESMFAEFK